MVIIVRSNKEILKSLMDLTSNLEEFESMSFEELESRCNETAFGILVAGLLKKLISETIIFVKNDPQEFDFLKVEAGKIEKYLRDNGTSLNMGITKKARNSANQEVNGIEEYLEEAFILNNGLRTKYDLLQEEINQALEEEQGSTRLGSLLIVNLRYTEEKSVVEKLGLIESIRNKLDSKKDELGKEVDSLLTPDDEGLIEINWGPDDAYNLKRRSNNLNTCIGSMESLKERVIFDEEKRLQELEVRKKEDAAHEIEEKKRICNLRKTINKRLESEVRNRVKSRQFDNKNVVEYLDNKLEAVNEVINFYHGVFNPKSKTINQQQSTNLINNVLNYDNRELIFDVLEGMLEDVTNKRIFEQEKVEKAVQQRIEVERKQRAKAEAEQKAKVEAEQKAREELRQKIKQEQRERSKMVVDEWLFQEIGSKVFNKAIKDSDIYQRVITEDFGRLKEERKWSKMIRKHNKEQQKARSRG